MARLGSMTAAFLAVLALTASGDVAHMVAASGQVGEMKTLLGKDSTCVDAADSLGMTPLMHAAAGANVPMVRFLIEAKADMARVDSLDRDALDCAIYAGAYDAARVLADKGATVDRVYANGQTRLTLAAARGDIAAVHFLLMSGADAGKANRDGLSPLDAAKKSTSTAVVDLLAGFEAPARPAVPASSLSPADSARLHAVTAYGTADSLFAAVRAGRRSFHGCSLKDADLAGMNLALLDFAGADLSGADLRGTVFVGADLSSANLKNAYLRKADLRRATLAKASLSDTYLTRADLRDVKGLELAQLRRARNLFRAKFDKELDEQARQYCKPQLKDPGNDWVNNPWFAESKIKPGDTTTALP